MAAIIKTELSKLKRYHILWAGVALMLLSVLLTLFTSLANDGSVWTFAYLIEQVIKTNATTIFPMCITLIAGYIISREKKHDTLKNLLTVPVTYRQLVFGKLLVCGLLSLFLGVVCTGFTLIAEALTGFPGFTPVLAFQAFVQITISNLLLYLAVLPIIVISSRASSNVLIGVIVAFVYGYGGIFAVGNMTLASLYPITASLGIIGYRSYDAAVQWNILLCVFSFVLSVGVSIIMIKTMRERETQTASKTVVRTKPKKGW